ncbi:hypothetical protein ACIGXI_00520 [Kitasatospora aureofaciens]|uniref:hypothetical protein n=1 Tax=Kitasatospora aureofaciens TaxID=1894 RepID=UPI0037C7C4E4
MPTGTGVGAAGYGWIAAGAGHSWAFVPTGVAMLGALAPAPTAPRPDRPPHRPSAAPGDHRTNPHRAVPFLLDPPVESAHCTGPREDADRRVPWAVVRWPLRVLRGQAAQAVGSGAGAAGPV